MITGYNTDVSHLNIVLHVQTEDKGLENPFIESLIYVGGQVLVATRAGYAKMLAAGSPKKEITALMDRQHRTMIAAIRQGKFDAKLGSLLGRQLGPAMDEIDVGQEEVAEPKTQDGVKPETRSATPVSSQTPPIDLSDRSLDQVILEYLANEAKQDQLVLQVEDERELALGRSATISVRAASSLSGDPVAGASINVRMISTTDDPRDLAAGETGAAGSLELQFDIPRLDRGTAALIVSAASALGSAEVKRLL